VEGKSSVATDPPECYKQESNKTMATSPLLGLLGNFAGPDMLIIFIVILLLFGAKKLPELARGMGQAVKEFSKAKDSLHADPHHADPHHNTAAPATNTTQTASVTPAPAASPTESAPKPNA
jgi:sec-independent protein translocase protein TatA